MDKETLSNYGWIVICVLVLAVLIALAGPFGTFVSNATKSTTIGLWDANETALIVADTPINTNDWDKGIVAGPVYFGKQYTCKIDDYSGEVMIFYPDGSGKATYYEGGKSMGDRDIPAGTYEYRKNTIYDTYGDMEYTISANKKVVTIDSGIDFVLGFNIILK